MLHLGFVLTGRRMTPQNGDPWQSICQSQRAQRLPCQLMSSLRLPLLSQLIFPSALRAAEKPGLGFSWETAVKREQSEQTFHFLFIPASKHARRQASKHMCAQTQLERWEAQLCPTPTGRLCPENFIIIIIKAEFHSLVCSAAYLCQPCVRRLCPCLWRLPALTGWQCVRVFVFRNPRVWSAHFRS